MPSGTSGKPEIVSHRRPRGPAGSPASARRRRSSTRFCSRNARTPWVRHSVDELLVDLRPPGDAVEIGCRASPSHTTRTCGRSAIGATSTTTSCRTSPGRVSASAIAALPPMLCPTSVTGRLAWCTSTIGDVGGHRWIGHRLRPRRRPVVAQVQREHAVLARRAGGRSSSSCGPTRTARAAGPPSRDGGSVVAVRGATPARPSPRGRLASAHQRRPRRSRACQHGACQWRRSSGPPVSTVPSTGQATRCGVAGGISCSHPGQR